MKKIIVIVIVSFCFLAVGCKDKKVQPKNATTIITAKMQQTSTPLYYNSMVQPYKIYNIPSITNGFVTKMYFVYGEKVKKNQKLVTIKSEDLAKNYQEALTDYVKQKETLTSQKIKFNGSQVLFKRGILAENDFKDLQNQLNDNYMSFLQAQWKLEKTLNQLGIAQKTIFSLNLSEQKEVLKALKISANELNITAPATGYVLLPLSSDSSSGDTKQVKLSQGSQIKTDQTLLTIGDMGGVSFDIKINEMYVKQIKIGQKATITGIAFPKLTLNGVVTSVSHQANESNSGDLPTFNVKVIVNNLTEAQREQLMVGMSAKVKIVLESKPSIMLPLDAVIQKQVGSFVKVSNPTTKKITEVPVQTGTTSVNQVEIVSGIKPGDQIVVSNH